MNIGLFGNEGNPLYEGSLVGLRSIGHRVTEQQASCWQRSQAMSFDGAVVCGVQGSLAEIANYYLGRGKPVVLVDLPMLRIPGQHLVREIASDLPYYGEPVPYDRWEALGIPIQPPHRRVKGQSILLIGQSTSDPTHGMSRNEFEAWAVRTMRDLRSIERSQIIWRPHPSDIWELQGADGFSDPRKVQKFEDALEGVWLVVTYSSTAGLLAMIAGRPVISDESAFYAELSGKVTDIKSLTVPDERRLTDLCARVAYTQWSGHEIRKGIPFERYFEVT